jgi:uncharacterized delta-60 repeat protein
MDKTIKILALTCLILLYGCGGGGEGDSSTNPSTIDRTVEVYYSKGPVTGATAVLLDANSNYVAGSVSTVNGTASFNNITYEGLVYAQFIGGIYTDEATGSTVILDSNFAIRSGIVDTTSISSIQLVATPLTEIGFQRAEAVAGSNSLDLTIVNLYISKVADEFGLDNINLTEIIPTPIERITVNQMADQYGAVLAAISQQMLNASGGSVSPSSADLDAYIGSAVSGINRSDFNTALNNLLMNTNTSTFISSTIVTEISNNSGINDSDGDGLADIIDPDDDNDGVADLSDAFPLDATETLDTDNDGIGNNADLDDDNDGVADLSDAFPLDATETLDTDNDGIGNNADPDDDNDGVADLSDAFPLDATRSVLDTEPPIIQLVGSADIKLFQGEFYEDPGVTVSDNLDTNVGITVSGEVLNQISSDYIITYDATDQAGNAANQVTRKVRVRPLSLNYSKFYGANGSVENIVAVPDNSGDYYVSGNFTIYNSLVANGIVRVNNDGTVDTTFNTGDGFNGQVRSLKVSANNDIYAVGDFTSYNGVNVNRIARLKSNGDLDQSFSIGSGFNDTATELEFSSDGSGNIYVVGNFAEYSGNTANRIIRLKSDGSIDADFNFGAGFDRETPFTVNNLINLEIPSDGSGDIYVSGDFLQYNGYSAPQIIRINDDGTLDNGFVTGTGFTPGINNQTVDITLANDGSGDIYVSGYFSEYNGVSVYDILRLNNDGTVDTGFQSIYIGYRVINVTPAIDGTGDIFVRAASGTFRLHSDGSRDRSFDSTDFAVSRVILPLNDNSGDILLGGDFRFHKTISANNIIRINSNGSVDDGFLTGSGFNGVEKIASTIDGSGDIYAAGPFTHYFGKPVNNLARLNHDGTLDSGFNAGGGFNGSVFCLAQAIDGSDDIYVGGNFTSYDGVVTSHLVKLNNDGSIDANFDKGIGIGSTVFSIAPVFDGSGDIYIGGHFTLYNGQFSSKIIRLKSNGAIDTTFSTGNGFDDVVTEITPTTDDSDDIYVGGNFTTYNGVNSPGIIRLNRDGTVDSEFMVGDGFANASPNVGGVGLWTVNTVIEATDGTGDVYVGGNFSAYKGANARMLVRLNRDGSLDTAFSFESELSLDYVTSILPANDGSGDIYIGAYFEIIYPALSSVQTGLVRMDSSGTINRTFDIDSNFNLATSTYTYQTGYISPVTDMLYYGESEIYIAGFYTAGRLPLHSLARITSSGEIN